MEVGLIVYLHSLRILACIRWLKGDRWPVEQFMYLILSIVWSYFKKFSLSNFKKNRRVLHCNTEHLYFLSATNISDTVSLYNIICFVPFVMEIFCNIFWTICRFFYVKFNYTQTLLFHCLVSLFLLILAQYLKWQYAIWFANIGLIYFQIVVILNMLLFFLCRCHFLWLVTDLAWHTCNHYIHVPQTFTAQMGHYRNTTRMQVPPFIRDKSETWQVRQASHWPDR